MNLTIKQRLIALVTGIAIAIIVIIGVAIRAMNHEVEALNKVYLDRVVPLQSLKVVADDYAVLVVDTSHKVRNGNISWAEGISNLDTAEDRIARIWRDYLTKELSAEEERLVADIKPMMRAADDSIALLRDIFEARDAEALTLYTINDLYPAIDPVSGKFGELVQAQIDLSEEVFVNAEAEYKSTVIMFSILGIAVIVSVILIGWRILISITKPIDDAMHFCENIAGGDLISTMDVRNQDEVGQMIMALNEMRAKLAEVVTDVRQRADTINSGVNEIASGNLDLSQRTEEQAASIEETASSMEEMTATTQQNADNARMANKLAENARDEAERGAQVVSGAMSAMTEINASSRKISDITGVVDEIAFQTNLLALNAAVEAARAGEAGRGFAVVATEVRVLAQRSAEAAKQIKSLIDDSVTKVEGGSKLVSDSANTLSGIVDSIKKVSDIVSEISAASEEQRDGIVQVNQAVSQMDQGTQQNAALVEESAAAAKSLSEQAHGLADRVAFFRVNAGVTGRTAPRPSSARPAPAIAPPAPARVSAAPKLQRQAPQQSNADDQDWEEF